MDAVSEVLIARQAKADGLSSMLSASAMAHFAMVALFVFLPAAWFGAEQKPPERIMEISLGGPVSPDKQGLTTLDARTIQQVVPEMKKAIEPVRPPSAKTPEMILPTKAPPKKTTPNKTDAVDPKSARPNKGKEIQTGSAVAETGATRGQGFGGLSGGGGGTGGVQLEVSDFCCPEYIATMTALIKSNWNSQAGAAGLTRMRFVIQKDGRIVDVTVLQSSGVQALDFYAQRALLLTKLPPLPPAFPEAALPVRLAFEYSR